MGTYVLQDWAMVYDPKSVTPYTAPELFQYKLTGKVYGHPEFEDGEVITTSRIEEQIDDETYKTKSGSIYKVGKKSLDYELFLEDYNARY